MIQSAELRIGNYIFWNIPQKQGVLHIVKGILENSLHTVPISIPDKRGFEEYEPIPLTPELLEKCGFKHGTVPGVVSFEEETKENEDTHFWDIPVKRSEYTDGFTFSLIVWGQQDYYTYAHQMLRIRIKYLHQLQNLFYTLTAMELKINL